MKNEKRLLKSNKGFTLVELVVAVAILVLVSLPFAVAFITATRINGTARNKERATTIATSEMEYLRSSDISSIFASADQLRGSPYTVPFSRSNGGGTITYDSSGVLVSHGEKYTTSGSANHMNSYTYTNVVKIDKKPFTVEAEITPFASSGSAIENQTAFYNQSGAANFPVINASKGTNVQDANFNISNSTNELMASKLADYYFTADSEYGVKTGTSGSYVVRKNSNTDKVVKKMYRDVVITINNTKMSDGSSVGVGSTTPNNGDKILTEVYAQATFRYQTSRAFEVELPSQCIYSNVYTYDDSEKNREKYSNLENIHYSFYGNANSVNRNVLDSVHIVNSDNLRVKVYLDDYNDALKTTNNYYFNIFLTGGVNWAGGINPVNYRGNDNILTTVCADTHIQKKCFYSDTTSNWRQTVVGHGGLYDAEYLMNYTNDIGKSSTATSFTPIYVIDMKVYSGEGSTRARKELIELNSTLQ